MLRQAVRLNSLTEIFLTKLDILDTLDTQIRQTEAIIAKLQQVKQGLLHDLLTRGIDANGHSAHPETKPPSSIKSRRWGGFQGSGK